MIKKEKVWNGNRLVVLWFEARSFLLTVIHHAKAAQELLGVNRTEWNLVPYLLPPSAGVLKCLVSFTFTLQALPDQPPQHLPTVIAEGRGFVGVDVEGMRSDLEVLLFGKSWNTQTLRMLDMALPTRSWFKLPQWWQIDRRAGLKEF